MSTITEHLTGLSPEALRDLARNHAARPEFRWAAAKRLTELGHRYAEHPEVVGLARPFWAATQDEYGQPVEPTPEAETSPETEQEVVVGLGPDELVSTPEGIAIVYDRARKVDENNLEEVEIYRSSGGPFRASITTDVLMQNEVVEPLEPEPNEPTATDPFALD